MCKSCGSAKLNRFIAEIAIHLPGLNKPHVMVFPELLVCLNCGKTECTVPDRELRALREGEAAIAG